MGHYEHHLQELHEAYLNRNREQAVEVASHAIRHSCVRRIDLADTELAKTVEVLHESAFPLAGKLRTPWADRLVTGEEAVEAVVAQLEDTREGFAAALAPRSGLIDDLSHLALFEAVVFQAVVLASRRRFVLPSEVTDGVLAIADLLCQRATELGEHNWVAWKHLAKSRRLRARVGMVPPADGPVAVLLEAAARAIPFVTGAEPVPDRADGKADLAVLIEMGQFFNDIGRSIEVEADHNAAELARASDSRAVDNSLSGWTQLRVSSGPDLIRPGGTAGPISLADCATRSLEECERDLAEVCGLSVPELVTAMGGYAAGLMRSLAVYRAAVAYLRWPVPDDDPRLRVWSRGSRSRWRLHIPIHNEARVLEKIAEQLALQPRFRRASCDFEERSVGLYRDAVSIEPRYAQAHETYALLLLKRDERPLARRHFDVLRGIYEGQRNRRRENLDYGVGEILLEQDARESRLLGYLAEAGATDQTTWPTLTVLKRWNSYTPSLPTHTKSTGGGYLLTVGAQGVAIDPGFGFLRNLSYCGYALDDVNAILVTHIHSDHWSDLEDLLLLKYEQWKRLHRKRNRHASVPQTPIYAAPLVAPKVQQRLESCTYEKEFRRAWRVEQLADEKMTPKAISDDLEVAWTPALHCLPEDGCSPEMCVASGFRLGYTGDSAWSIGFTGDTSWFDALPSYFKGVDVLVAHMGRVYPEDIAALNCPEFRHAGLPVPKGGHLGYFGAVRLLRALGRRQPKLVVMSEFGEELAAFRLAIASALQDVAGKVEAGIPPSVVVSGDVGQCYYLPRDSGKGPMFHCSACGHGRKRDILTISQFSRPWDDDEDLIVNRCARHEPLQ